MEQDRPDQAIAHRAKLEVAFKRFCRMVDIAEQRFRDGESEAAVALAQIAARLAFPANVGLLASPRLEKLLVSIGKSLPIPPKAPTRQRAERPQHILHVLSYARPVGGDTRFVWRWIQQDQANAHFVAVTTQQDINGLYEIPAVLSESAERSGGFFHPLRTSTAYPLKQALELRQLCQDMDTVVLHLFPYDVIPILALSAGCEHSKILFVNHSDHTFWLGGSIAHLIVHLRAQPSSVLKDRRFLKSGHSVLLPIPLACPQSPSRAAARAALGYGDDRILLLTIASSFKYSSPGRQGLLDLVVPVLREMPQAILIAVGPAAEENAWREASLQTHGRVIARGPQFDNVTLYAAADIYLDSIPFSSITSLLEAGSLGVPLLGYASPEPNLSLLGPSAPGLEGTMEMGTDAHTYQSLLHRLIADPDYRAKSGDQVHRQILAYHTAAGWRALIQDVYRQLSQVEDRGCLNESTDTFAADSLDVALLQLYQTVEGPAMLRQLLWRFLGPLPYGMRILIVLELYQQGFTLSIPNLLPSSFNKLARRLARLAHRSRRQVNHWIARIASRSAKPRDIGVVERKI